ncbi:hypothetical protein CMO94_00580 [Candidatus Woesearchaeota archaeon]|jgi:hypothetical protein|nr:hypothetical protein [Candidatus Woesearchaeota archaeon]|tara:strand:+ start:194 stop:517 length:324 start_codon:yes stop_codon:yes gene_type:complete
MVNDNNGGENVPWFEEHPFMFVARFHRIDPAPDIRIKSDLEVYADPGAIVPNTIAAPQEVRDLFQNAEGDTVEYEGWRWKKRNTKRRTYARALYGSSDIVLAHLDPY